MEFRCERWVTSDGTLLTAALPDGIEGHFGPELCRFILAQYHQGQVTVPRLVEMLQALGLSYRVIDIASETRFYYFSLIILVLVLLAVTCVLVILAYARNRGASVTASLAFIDAAIAAGGTEAKPPQDYGGPATITITKRESAMRT